MVAGESTTATPSPQESELLSPEIDRVDVRNVDDALEVEPEEASEEAGASRSGRTTNLRLENGVNVVPSGQGIAFGLLGVMSKTNFPLSLNRTTGQLSVTTPNGVRFIRILPDQASEIARAEGVAKIEAMELVEAQKTDSGDQLAFKITGKRAGSFLGVFPIDGTIEVGVGAQSGLVVFVSQPWWLSILSPLIR